MDGITKGYQDHIILLLGKTMLAIPQVNPCWIITTTVELYYG